MIISHQAIIDNLLRFCLTSFLQILDLNYLQFFWEPIEFIKLFYKFEYLRFLMTAFAGTEPGKTAKTLTF